MTKTTAILAAVATAAFAVPALAQAPQSMLKTVPLSQAVAAAEAAVGGRAYDAELDHERGALVYDIGLVKNGRAVEAHVDAVTGKVVHQTQTAVRLPFTADHLKVAQGAPRTLTQTIALVENATKGRVSDIELERDGGRYYYEAKLAGAQDREVRVDLRTGALSPVIDD